MALGPDLAMNPFLEHKVTYLSDVFKGKSDFIFYFTSFYIFLNISAMPVQTCVLRNNLISFFLPD